jgi:hypothetical protein
MEDNIANGQYSSKRKKEEDSRRSTDKMDRLTMVCKHMPPPSTIQQTKKKTRKGQEANFLSLAVAAKAY